MGIRLEEMEARDMLDVLHYFFESDISHITTPEQHDSITAMRTSLYGLYGVPYTYAATSTKSTSGGRQYVSGDYEFGPVVPFDPAAQAPKPFVPATDFNPDSAMPFGNVLDAPIG